MLGIAPVADVESFVSKALIKTTLHLPILLWSLHMSNAGVSTYLFPLKPDYIIQNVYASAYPKSLIIIREIIPLWEVKTGKLEDIIGSSCKLLFSSAFATYFQKVGKYV